MVLFKGEVASHDPLEGVLELLVGCRVAERVEGAESETGCTAELFSF